MNFIISYQKVFIITFISTLILMISLQIIGSNLITPVSPMGIVSFEFSSNLENALAIVNSWGETGKIYAALDLGLDYLFILFYTSTLISGCFLIMWGASSENHKTILLLSKLMITGALIAALLDAIENFALIKILTGNGSETLAALAIYCAIPKFILVGIIILFIISTWVYSKLSNFRN